MNLKCDAMFLFDVRNVFGELESLISMGRVYQICSHIFLYSGKGIELYIRFFGNDSKMHGEVKFVIKNDSKYLFSLLFLLVTLLDKRSI